MEISHLILFILIILIILISLIIIFINSICETLRKFITENSGFFTIFFMLLFFIEQVIFILIIVYFFEISKWLSITMGIFALIVVTTASLQKFIWEYKYQHTNRKYESVLDDNNRFLYEIKQLVQENAILKGFKIRKK